MRGNRIQEWRESARGGEFSPWARSGDTAGASQEWTPFVEGDLAAKPNQATTCTFFEGLATISLGFKNKQDSLRFGRNEGEGKGARQRTDGNREFS